VCKAIFLVDRDLLLVMVMLLVWVWPLLLLWVIAGRHV
jgi:hypothetical protein